MASAGHLETAERLLRCLDTYQSQASLSSQARDCVRIVEALGYYDLADHLKRLSEHERPGVDAHRPARGSDVEAYLRRWRDGYVEPGSHAWEVADDLLEDYRLRADTGKGLGEEVSEGGVPA